MPVDVAIVGCGAITELGYMPAVSRVREARVTVLVDKNRSRAEALAHTYGVPYVTEDYTQVYGRADAAIVALPHYLHASVSVYLLNRGIHVLVEKPMALSTAECDNMIQASKQGGALLAVGLMRRFLRSARFTKKILDIGLLGPVESFDVREGLIYNWPVTSDFFFRRETAGGGVLVDTGAHTLDMLLWWLGDVLSFEYFDDNCGGVEADCELYLVMKNGSRGIVELSRTRNLRNTAIIRGEMATLEVGLHTNLVSLYPRGVDFRLSGPVTSVLEYVPFEQSLVDCLSMQLQDWLDAIRNGNSPCVPGTEGCRSVALIEACYAQRKPLKLPWMRDLALAEVCR